MLGLVPTVRRTPALIPRAAVPVPGAPNVLAPMASGPSAPGQGHTLAPASPDSGMPDLVFSPGARSPPGTPAMGPPVFAPPLTPEVIQPELWEAQAPAFMVARDVVQQFAQQGIQLPAPCPGAPEALRHRVNPMDVVYVLEVPVEALGLARQATRAALLAHPAVRVVELHPRGRGFPLLAFVSGPGARVGFAGPPGPTGLGPPRVPRAHIWRRGPGVGRFGIRPDRPPPAMIKEPFRPELGLLAGAGKSVGMVSIDMAQALQGLGTQGGFPTGGWGAGATTEAAAQQITGEATSDYTATLQQLAPLVQAGVEAVADPYQRVAILEQRLVTFQRLGLPASNWMVRRTQAQLEASKHKLAVQEEGLASTREWRGLGKAGIAVAVVAGLSLTALLITIARAVGRRPVAA